MASPFQTGAAFTTGPVLTAFQEDVTVDDGGGGSQGNVSTTDFDSAGAEARAETDPVLPGPEEDFALPLSAGGASASSTEQTGIVSDVSGLVENVIILVLVVVALQMFDVINL